MAGVSRRGRRSARDRDGSPQGRDSPARLGAQHDSPAPKGIAPLPESRLEGLDGRIGSVPRTNPVARKAGRGPANGGWTRCHPGLSLSSVSVRSSAGRLRYGSASLGWSDTASAARSTTRKRAATARASTEPARISPWTAGCRSPAPRRASAASRQGDAEGRVQQCIRSGKPGRTSNKRARAGAASIPAA